MVTLKTPLRTLRTLRFNSFICIAVFLCVFAGFGAFAVFGFGEEEVADMDAGSFVDKIKWLGHDSFRIDADGNIIYIDPWKLAKFAPKADIILVTHEHYDHCSFADIDMLQKEDTVIVTIPMCASKVRGNVKSIRPNESINIKDLKIQAVPAYNIKKPFHPKQDGCVGFLISTQGVNIYHAGDTDLIPEMNNIKADIALLPVSGTYVMNSKEAAEAAKVIKPKIAIPMHYGDPDVAGTLKDAQDFKELLKDSIDVRVLPVSK